MKGNSTEASCTCKNGFGGQACTIACPGVVTNGVPCSENGDCEVDEDANSARCQCKESFMGSSCQYRCPMDRHSELACGGETRGKCVRDANAVPDKTRCDCIEPYVGKTCHAKCPTFQGKVCGGQGECFIKASGKVQLGICKCNVGFVGESCSEQCPRDSGGATCAGHGICSMDIHKRSQCQCDDGWVGKNCASRVCNTKGGVFSKSTEQCTCPQGEVCCTQKTQRLAAMMSKMLAKDKAHRTARKVIEARTAMIQEIQT